jgi:MFS transporter, LPLT family, lysophospholipid transporter
VGASGGFLGAGQAIAVQNLFENTTMLLMIGAYTLLVHSGATVTALAAGFGSFLTLTIGLLWWYRIHRQRQRAQ